MDVQPWDVTDTYEWLDRARRGFGPVIVTCCVNGGEQGAESCPALPEAAEQIAEEAQRAYEAGASAIHIHARDPEDLGSTAQTAEAFAEVNRLVRSACPDMIINNTSSSVLDDDGSMHLEILDALPEMASLNLGPEMTRSARRARPEPLPHPRPAEEHDSVWPWTYGRIEALAAAMASRGIKPELELYHGGQYWVTRALLEAGLLEQPLVHQLVMGYQTSAFATPQHVLDLARDLPAGSLLFVAGIGPYQLPLTTFAMVLGAHVRVGLEDNVYYRRGELCTSNADLVGRARRIAEELGRGVATPAEARAALGLGEPRRY